MLPTTAQPLHILGPIQDELGKVKYSVPVLPYDLSKLMNHTLFFEKRLATGQSSFKEYLKVVIQ